jgi:hypothetical protein
MVLPWLHDAIREGATWINNFIQAHFSPAIPPPAEGNCKMTFKDRAGVPEAPLGVGFGGGEARKRFVEQGDDSLLFGEWGDWNKDFS